MRMAKYPKKLMCELTFHHIKYTEATRIDILQVDIFENVKHSMNSVKQHTRNEMRGIRILQSRQIFRHFFVQMYTSNSYIYIRLRK